MCTRKTEGNLSKTEAKKLFEIKVKNKTNKVIKHIYIKMTTCEHIYLIFDSKLARNCVFWNSALMRLLNSSTWKCTAKGPVPSFQWFSISFRDPPRMKINSCNLTQDLTCFETSLIFWNKNKIIQDCKGTTNLKTF